MYVCIIYLEKKVGNQRCKNVNNEAKMNGKRRINERTMSLKKGIYYLKIFSGIFLSFLHRFSRFCVVGLRLFSRYDIIMSVFIIFLFGLLSDPPERILPSLNIYG